MPAERQLDRDALVGRRHSELLQVSDLRTERELVGQVVERRATP
jgi:hypothetical protein